MSPSASLPVSIAPGGLELAPGGREPLPSGGAPPGAPPEGPPFKSALETEWARTAIAEGQQQSHPQHSGRRVAATPSDTKATAGLAPSASTPAGSAPTPAAAPPGGTPTDELVAGATGELTVGTSGGPGVSIAGGSGMSSASGPGVSTAGGPEGATGKLTAGASTGQMRPGISTSATGADGTPNSGAPTAPGSSAGVDGALTAAAVAHEDAPPATPTSPAVGAAAVAHDGASTAGVIATPRDGAPKAGGNASALAAVPKDAAIAGDGTPTRSTPAAAPAGIPLTPHSSSTLSAGTGEAGAHDKLWVANPTQASPDGAASGGGHAGGLSENTASPLMPAAADGNSAPTAGELGASGYGVGLQEAIESLHGTIQLAARQGLTQARISLQPEELGEIRINLTQTAQGLLARVTAESPAAAQALAGAHAQLRQSLSSLGINLTRLDIGHHDPAQSGGANAKGGGQNGAVPGEGFAGGRPGRSTAIAAPADPETETDSPVAEEPAPTTTAPSNGTLIDVLA